MSFAGGKLIWMNGQVIPWEQATVHIMSHALHYGSSIFEGIRVYKTPDGPQVFRLTDHMRRFYDSAKIYRMPIGYECDELVQVCKDLIDQVPPNVLGGVIGAALLLLLGGSAWFLLKNRTAQQAEQQHASPDA